MKRILCYGDSNTYGHNPVDGTRLPYNERWPGILAGLLGEDYQIIEEGLCGRTTAMDDPTGYGLNGLAYLEPCLLSHFPLDMIIVMLGTNDLQMTHHCIPQTIAISLQRILGTISFVKASRGSQAKVLLISPIHIGDTTVHPYFKDLFPVGDADEKSHLLAPLLKEVANLTGSLYLDASSVAAPSAIDGLHMDPENHLKLAKAVCAKIHEVL